MSVWNLNLWLYPHSWAPSSYSTNAAVCKIDEMYAYLISQWMFDKKTDISAPISGCGLPYPKFELQYFANFANLLWKIKRKMWVGGGRETGHVKLFILRTCHKFSIENVLIAHVLWSSSSSMFCKQDVLPSANRFSGTGAPSLVVLIYIVRC